MAQENNNQYNTAVDLFMAGKFEDAQDILVKMAAREPDEHRVVFLIGYLALLSNRLSDAQDWLSRALKINPEDSGSQALLAEVFYRQDDFQQAAPLFSGIGREAMAKKLASFETKTPYLIEKPDRTTSIDFMATDPLPIVQVCVNGSEPVIFFIDTGASEVFIDSEFAREIGITDFGAEMGTFAGGDQAEVRFGRIESLTLGDLVIRNLPVNILNTRRFSDSGFGDRRIDGIIGTTLFYHFLTTLDYPKQQLILRPKTEKALQAFENDLAKNRDSFPFWMAGDHYMVAWGTLNRGEPMLFFVDTGMIGGAFSCPDSTLKQANIELQSDFAAVGQSGAGEVIDIPFLIDELTLGATKAKNLTGQFSGEDPLEYSFGFRIGGLISHDFFKPYSLTFDFINMRCILQ